MRGPGGRRRVEPHLPALMRKRGDHDARSGRRKPWETGCASSSTFPSPDVARGTAVGGPTCRWRGVTMELRELEWFTTLAETEHMTEASLCLNVSQPTLSRALARLERKLGVKLFDRHHNGLRLNKYGEIFQAHALRAMSELDRGEERIVTLVDPERGSVSLGFVHSFGGWLVPDLLHRYRKLAPSTSFELRGGAC